MEGITENITENTTGNKEGLFEEENVVELKGRHSKRENTNIIGKLITLIQLTVSVGLVIILWNSGLIPVKFLMIGLAVLLALFAGTFAMQFLRSYVRIPGMVLSIVITVILAVGITYFSQADKTLKSIGGAAYKTDNMIVVVKKTNKAENLLQAKNFRFGYQTAADQKNNERMLEDVQSVVGREIKLVDYPSIQEEAQALLDGKVEAAIYNEAFTGIIEEAIEGYSEEVRILYQYGIDTEIPQEEKDIGKPFHIYISGIDVAGPITTNSRSDVNLIMTVNPDTKQILLTTTPRDYYVRIPNVSGKSRDKLTHAGIYGVDCSMATLENIYDIDIAYYARVNFTSLIEIIDAVGGIDVESKYEFTTLHGNYDIKKGVNHMDGDMALGFARERYSFAEGDNQRGKNQEAVLAAILKKAMSPAILKNASKILASVGDSVETNMTTDEMARFIQMQMEDGSGWEIKSQASTGKGDKQACFSSGSQKLYVMWPDKESVEANSEQMKQVLEGK